MQFTKTTLPSGLRVITVPMRDNPATTVLVMVEAGSKYETSKTNGISHFLEHMVFKGTPRRPKGIDISRELDSMGAQYNAFTSQEYTGYYAKTDARYFDRALDVVSDMYLNPLFEQFEIEKESGVIVEEIRMYQDLPHRHVQDLFMELLYGDQPAGWNIAGSEATVKSFNKADFVEYRSAHYLAQSTIVVVSGAIDEKEALAKVEKAFASLGTGKKDAKLKVNEVQDKPKIFAHYKETDQTHLVLGVRSFDINHPDTAATRVLATILGGSMSSRLFQKLRDEMGVGYYVRAEHDPYTDHGIFAVSTGVDNSRVDEVIKVIIAELKKVVDATVTDEELQRAKDYIVGHISLGLETSDEQGQYCAFQEVLRGKIKSPEEAAEEIRKVTAADIQRIAKQIFVDKNLNMAIIGRVKDGTRFEPFFSFEV